MSAIQGWPGRNTPVATRTCELQRLVSVDHPDQRLIPHRPIAAPMGLRVDDTHALPIELYEGAKMVARFAHAYEVATYLMARRGVGAHPAFTIPASIAEALATMSGEADLVERLRHQAVL